MDEVYNALHRDPTYSRQEHGRKCRCVWLKYAPEHNVGCHLDIVPFVTLPSGRQVIVNRDINRWEPDFGSTNPQGFTDWVKRRDELTDNEFRRVVRLMKYLKRERGGFNGVKSVILTTLLGQQVTEFEALDPAQFANLPTTLVNIVEKLDAWAAVQHNEAVGRQPKRRWDHLRPSMVAGDLQQLPRAHSHHHATCGLLTMNQIQSGLSQRGRSCWGTSSGRRWPSWWPRFHQSIPGSQCDRFELLAFRPRWLTVCRVRTNPSTPLSTPSRS